MSRSRRTATRGPWLRGLLWAIGGMVVVIGGLGLALFLRLSDVARDLDTARGDLRDAADLLETGEVAQARERLRGALDVLVASNDDLFGFETELLGWLPVISDNVDALRESVGLALRLADGGVRTLRAAQPLEGEDGSLEVPLADGAIPLDAVRDAQRELRALLGDLPTAAPGRDAVVLDRIEEARDELFDEAIGRRAQVINLSNGLSLVADMSGGGGPRRYLIAVANTAEMRGAGGMILSYGVLEGQAGDFELGAFGRIDELALAAPLPDGAVPSLPADYLARWAGFDVLLRWRNATMAGDFTLVAPVLEAMYRQATGQAVHGVIQIDPQGLAAILEGIGPVTVDELGLVDANNVVELVLNEAYRRFPDIDERSDVLGDVAEATFEKLVTGRYPSLRPLGEALVRTVAGRHVLMHTSTPAQANVAFFRAEGALPAPEAEHLHLTVQNVSANKLDYYVDTAVEVSGERPGGAHGQLEVAITVANQAPSDETDPRYVFGPNTADQEAGVYRGIVSLYVPTGTSLASASGSSRNPPAVFPEGGRTVISYPVDLPAGGASTVVLHIELAPRPAGPYSLTVVPSPRVRPTAVSVDIDTGDGVVHGDGTLDRRLRFGPPSRDAP